MALFVGPISLGRLRAREDGTFMTTTIQTRRRSAGGGIGQRAARHRFALCTLAVIGLFAAGRAQGLEIAGVLPNSIGLPEVNIVLRSTAGEAPYSGLDSFAFPLTSLRMIYDTGASGMIVFEGPAQALSLPVAQFSAIDIAFADVGIGGSAAFQVSDDLQMSLGSFTQDPPNPYTADSDYPRQSPGLRLQLGPPGSAGLFISDFTQLGVAGMPAMAGRVSVINPKLAEVSFFELTPADTIHTHVYDPAVPPETGPGILTSDFHVELFMKSFDRFTQTTPAGATGPTLNANPFIGPDPLAALEGASPPPDTPPGITISLNGSEATGTFLLDSGAQITSVSSAMALTVGVRYWAPGDPGHDPGSPATLVLDADGSLVPDQFTVTIGGIAGTTTIAGFYLDSLLVRTMEGDPLVDSHPDHLRFVPAPVYVHDIELMDPVTLDTFAFDGIFGTNYLFGSGDLSALAGFEVPFRTGPFEWLVLDFDSSPPTLGLILAPAPTPTATPTATPTPIPEPGAILQLVAGGVGLAFLNDRWMRKNRRTKPTS
jgi:hypothetical protein